MVTFCQNATFWLGIFILFHTDLDVLEYQWPPNSRYLPYPLVIWYSLLNMAHLLLIYLLKMVTFFIYVCLQEGMSWYTLVLFLRRFAKSKVLNFRDRRYMFKRRATWKRWGRDGGKPQHWYDVFQRVVQAKLTIRNRLCVQHFPYTSNQFAVVWYCMIVLYVSAILHSCLWLS